MRIETVVGLTQAECGRRLKDFLRYCQNAVQVIINPPVLSNDRWIGTVIRIDKTSERDLL